MPEGAARLTGGPSKNSASSMEEEEKNLEKNKSPPASHAQG